MAVVAASENEGIELEPALEGVAGSANADDRPAGRAVALNALELGAVELEAPGKYQEDIGLVEILEGGIVFFRLVDDEIRLNGRCVLRQIVSQHGERILGVVLEGSG